MPGLDRLRGLLAGLALLCGLLSILCRRGQGKPESRSLAWLRIDPNGSAVPFDGLFAYRQSDAATLVLGHSM